MGSESTAVVVRVSYPWSWAVAELLAERIQRVPIFHLTRHLIETRETEEKRCLHPVMHDVLRGIRDLPMRDPLHVFEDFRRLRICGGERGNSG